MILLKVFFRKRTTKIYLVIFSVMLISLLTFFTYLNYYVSLANEIYQNNSQMIVVSKIDYYNKLIKSKNFVTVKKAIVFKPDYTYDTFGRECYEVHDGNTGALIDENNDCPEGNIFVWEDFYVNYINVDNHYIVVFPDSKLLDGKVNLGYSSYSDHKAESSNDFIGKKIGFYSGNKKMEFEIDSFHKSHFPEVLVSEKTFKNLSKSNNLYAYIGIIKDYRYDYSIETNLEADKNIAYASADTIFSGGASMTKLQDLISSLTLISYVVIFIFSIVFLVVIKNSMADEYKNTYAERILGYNKNQLRKYLFLKILALNIAAFFISTAGSIIINILINCSKVNLVIIDFNLLLKIYGSVLLVSLFFCLLYNIGKNKSLKFIRF